MKKPPNKTKNQKPNLGQGRGPCAVNTVPADLWVAETFRGSPPPISKHHVCQVLVGCYQVPSRCSFLGQVKLDK